MSQLERTLGDPHGSGEASGSHHYKPGCPLRLAPSDLEWLPCRSLSSLGAASEQLPCRARDRDRPQRLFHPGVTPCPGHRAGKGASTGRRSGWLEERPGCERLRAHMSCGCVPCPRSCTDVCSDRRKTWPGRERRCSGVLSPRPVPNGDAPQGACPT